MRDVNWNRENFVNSTALHPVRKHFEESIKNATMILRIRARRRQPPCGKWQVDWAWRSTFEKKKKKKWSASHTNTAAGNHSKSSCCRHDHFSFECTASTSAVSRPSDLAHAQQQKQPGSSHTYTLIFQLKCSPQCNCKITYNYHLVLFYSLSTQRETEWDLILHWDQ